MAATCSYKCNTTQCITRGITRRPLVPLSNTLYAQLLSNNTHSDTHYLQYSIEAKIPSSKRSSTSSFITILLLTAGVKPNPSPSEPDNTDPVYQHWVPYHLFTLSPLLESSVVPRPRHLVIINDSEAEAGSDNKFRNCRTLTESDIRKIFTDLISCFWISFSFVFFFGHPHRHPLRRTTELSRSITSGPCLRVRDGSFRRVITVMIKKNITTKSSFLDRICVAEWLQSPPLAQVSGFDSQSRQAWLRLPSFRGR